MIKITFTIFLLSFLFSQDHWETAIFDSDEWKYIEAGTNMSEVVRLLFYAGTTGTCVWIIDEQASSGWHQSEVDGFVTIVQEHPLAT